MRPDRKAKKEARDARNAQIVARILAGEKRYMLAEEFGMSRGTLTRIGARAGLKLWSRFGRQVNN